MIVNASNAIGACGAGISGNGGRDGGVGDPLVAGTGLGRMPEGAGGSMARTY